MRSEDADIKVKVREISDPYTFIFNISTPFNICITFLFDSLFSTKARRIIGSGLHASLKKNSLDFIRIKFEIVPEYS